MKNKETLLEVAERYSLELLEAKTIQPHEKTWIKAIFILGIKWQSERSYSEKDMIEFSKFCQTDEFENRVVNKSLLELFKELRKKDTWYNEEKTNKRMNVIGQNGNDGAHYENK